MDNNTNQPLPDDLYDDDFIDDDEAFEDDEDEPLTEDVARRLLEQPSAVIRRPSRFAQTNTQRVASAADLIARADERRAAPRPMSARQRERAELREKAKAFRPPAAEQENVVRVPELLFNVSQLLKENEGAHREYDVAAAVLPLELPDEPGASLDPDAPVAHNIRGHIKFTRVRKDVLAEGTFEADVTVPCSRCLEPTTIPVEAEIEEQFRPSIDVFTGVPVYYDTADDEADLKIDHNHILNLGEALRQQFLVSMPLQPLHADDCKGLCATCGKNLNVEEHDCEDEPIDPRWSALANLTLPE